MRTVQVVEDSIDGKPLPEDTQPLMIGLDRGSWQLLLSEAIERMSMEFHPDRVTVEVDHVPHSTP